MSPMTKGSFPKASTELKQAFAAMLPDEPAVSIKPMFGNVAAVVNGNMFAGVFGEDVFVRVSEPDMDELLAEGGTMFEPMPGRTSRNSVTLPHEWSTEPRRAGEWVLRALEWARSLPAKEPRRKAPDAGKRG